MASRLLCCIAIFAIYATIYLHLAASSLAIKGFELEQQEVSIDCRRQDFMSFVKCLRRQKRDEDEDNDTSDPTDSPNTRTETFPSNATTEGVIGPPYIRDHPVVHLVIQPVLQPAVQPAIQPVLQPAIQPANQPDIQSAVQLAVQSAIQPAVQLGVQPFVQQNVQAGCAYPYQWLCGYSTYQRPRVDCSACTVPYYYYKCDVSCYSMAGSHAQMGSVSYRPGAYGYYKK